MGPVGVIFCGAGLLLVGSVLGIFVISYLLLYTFFSILHTILPDDQNGYPKYAELSKEPDDHIR